MNRLIAAVVGVVFLAVFVGFLLFAVRDLRSHGLKAAPRLLLKIAALVVFAVLVDLTVITALGTNATATFHKVAPPQAAPLADKAQEATRDGP